MNFSELEKKANLKWAKIQFSSKERIRIYRKLASLLNNGVPILQALEMIQKQASRNGKNPNDPIAIAMKTWIRTMQNGERFYKSIGDWAPDSEKMMISSGENSGNLEIALENVCIVMESSSEMKSAVIGAIIYPIILGIAAIGVMVLFGVKVIPAFSNITDPESWDGVAASMNYMSKFVLNYLVYAVIGLLILIGIIVYSLPNYTGKYRKILDKLPPWSIYKLLIGSGFFMAMVALIRSGTAVEKSLAMLEKNSSPWLKQRINATLFGIRSGFNFGVSLDKTGYQFPDQSIIDDIIIYADLNGFDKALSDISSSWLKEGVKSIQSQSKAMNGVATGIMGLIVVWMTLGLFAIQNIISSSVGTVH